MEAKEGKNAVYLHLNVNDNEEEEEEGLLSKRGTYTMAYEDFLNKEAFWEPFDHISNPEGHIYMRKSENHLMDQEILARMRQSDALAFLPEHQHYYDFNGVPRLGEAVARFLNTHFKALQSVLPENVVLLSGVTSCLDAVAHAFCDQGDVILTPTPTYSRIFTDVEGRSLARVVPLVMSPEEDSEGKTFNLRAEAVEERIKALKAKGQRVKAFLFINPNNPLGDVYPPTLTSKLMDICAKYKIHFICDEIYGQSLFEETAFHSVLSLPHPDPQRTHMLWGISKDLSLPGLRVGAVVSRCRELITCLKRMAEFQPIPHIVQETTAAILNDKVWYEDFYRPICTKRLTEEYWFAYRRLKDMGVAMRKAKSGFFLWVDLRPFMPRQTEEEEMALYEDLLDAGVSVVPGSKMHSSQPGWFRVVFSIKRPVLEEGLKRIGKVLNERGRVWELNSLKEGSEEGEGVEEVHSQA